MQSSRRTFIRASALATAGAALGAGSGLRAQGPVSRTAPPILKAPRLRPGDTVGLINPAGATWSAIDIDVVKESFEAMGLRVKIGPHVLGRYGPMAGRDEERAGDLNAMFRDPQVRAVVCVRGGMGSSRILPLIDYDAIRRDPKILLGYSDITALHMAVQAKTGLVTFHGPVGISRWNAFNVRWVRALLFDGATPTLENDRTFDAAETLVQRDHRTRAITPGTARGRLLGGNLTVFTTILGSDYLPSFADRIFFFEDVEEAPYRIDRMITQLKLAGVLRQAKAFVWGTCTDCEPGNRNYGTLTIEEILDDHIAPLKVPAWHGAQFGHIDAQFTIPQGIEAEVDAAKGTIRLLEPAVS
jgi:muramoyltetrapeptide carboxypeptidase